MLAVAMVLMATVLSAASAVTGEASAAPVIVGDVVVDTQPTGTTIWIRTSRQARYVDTLIDTPPRLVIDVADATFAWKQSRLAVRNADIKEVRGSQFRPGITRVVIELAREASYTIEPDAKGIRVAIARASDKASAASRPRAQAPPARPSVEPMPAGGRPRLQGIVLRESGAVAYIQNPQTKGVAGYRVGDDLGGSILEAIEEDHVVLKSATDRIVLRIAPLPRQKP
jgi:AMIN domain